MDICNLKDTIYHNGGEWCRGAGSGAMASKCWHRNSLTRRKATAKDANSHLFSRFYEIVVARGYDLNPKIISCHQLQGEVSLGNLWLSFESNTSNGAMSFAEKRCIRDTKSKTSFYSKE
ncbi:hypothetical protein EVAR_42941_1 [Eumeta japonica]|uniref:Uncharacterized protein n=1 Tax=Eumeta variegata TaxID=151549 RepID=A0A4C1YGK7_EUMVA|nr:hypothetical protein EVAR_42941_1 [Eumeta japonica]